jgi:hypothetical protein
MVKQSQDHTQPIEEALRSAVIVSWSELIRSGLAGSIHVEYDFTSGGGLDCLQVWTSKKKGYWLLACTFRMSVSESHGTGIHFDNGYYSERLADNLRVLMHHQDAFLPAANPGRRGVFQIASPTQDENVAANALMDETLKSIGSAVTPRLM